MSIERVLMQIKDGPSSQWPQPMLVLVKGLDISRYEVIRHSREGSYYLKSLDGQELPRPWNIEHLK